MSPTCFYTAWITGTVPTTVSPLVAYLPSATPPFSTCRGGPCLLKEKPRSSVTPKVTRCLPLPSRLSQIIFCHLLFFLATLIFQTQEALLLLRRLCTYFFDTAVIPPFAHLHQADAQLPPSCHSLHHHNLSCQAPSRSTTSLYVFIWSVGLPP